MKRRRFLGGAARAGLAAALAAPLAAPAIAQGKRELRMVLSWPKSLLPLASAAVRLAERIGALSEGRLAVKVYGAGELVPPSEVFDAVAAGAADMYHSAAYHFQARSKALNFFSTVPFGLTSGEAAAWVRFGGGQELWDQLAAGFNLKPFLVGNSGARMGGWFLKEVASADDFKGLKLHVAGLGGEVVRRLGAAAVDLPAPEILPALQSGALHGAEWLGPYGDLSFGLHRAAKLYYYPGVHGPGAMLDFSVNLKVWESLGRDQQEMIRIVAAAEHDAVAAEFSANNAAALDALVAKHDVRLVKFADPVLQALGQKAGEVLAEIAGQDPMTRKVFDSYLAFRKAAMKWSRYGEQAFLAARLLPFRYG
jgi:TRAP-type mannitol/chloroaromatic compound transport system substrate-binding protein